MLRAALAATLLSGCTATTMAGASSVTAVAIGSSALQRRSGGCYAVCANGTSCNPRTGLCERMPCDGLCGADQHCEVTAIETKCAPGASSDVVATAPGKGKTLPVLPPPPPVEGGPPRVIPAAEQHPPNDK